MLIAALALACAGFVLRRLMLAHGFDEHGLPLSGSGLTIALCILAGMAVLLLGLACGALPKREAFARAFPPGRAAFCVSALSAALLLAGSAADVFSAVRTVGGAMPAVLLGFLGILGAMCVFLSAAGRLKGAKPMTVLYLIPFFFLVVRLIVDFKSRWSSDPVILDYCFNLFAMLAAMSASYHLAGYCFDRGRRARTTFWCLTAVVFCGISIADGGLSDCLTYDGLALWFLTNAALLLGPGAPARPAEEAASAEPAEAPDAPTVRPEES